MSKAEELRLMYTIGVVLSVLPFPECKPSLDMFIDPNLDVIKTILAIEVSLLVFYSYKPILYKNIIYYRITLNVISIDLSYKKELKFLVH